MRTIYLLLTNSNAIASRLIRAATGDAYTHVSISLEPQLRSLYSFARLYTHFPLPGGFVRESLSGGYFGNHGGMPCAVYAMEISEEAYTYITERISGMCRQSRRYRYSLLGVMLCRLGLARDREYKFFCSQFVATMLEDSGAAKLPKPASLMHPSDFEGLREARLIYRGELIGAGAAAQPIAEGECV